MNEEIQPLLFSIVIPFSGSLHLLPQTLDTIRFQSEKRFEVILLANCALSDVQKISDIYADLNLRVHRSKCLDAVSMMNEGALVARGKYLHFLCPGDRFLSQQGLSCVEELISEIPEPDMLYSGFLAKDKQALPQAVLPSLDLDGLRRGLFPAHLRSLWFLRKRWLALGGLDRALKQRSSLDLVCRLLQKKELKIACSRRVLTDSVSPDHSLKELFCYTSETCLILTKYFGVKDALFWVWLQGRHRGVRWISSWIKQAFFKKEET